ncbi:MAG: T9SS type A sorting domain-containing protein [Bacteroidetes bacterium]|nr:MAG: T9SS type A sorting domain-containing protein [Bacteroidota bacterium]
MVIRLLRQLNLFVIILISATAFPIMSQSHKSLADDPTPPANPVRLVFIHHSTGGNWLADGWGGLGRELSQNNYYISDVCYGWGKNGIGDKTDLGHWWEWFRDQENSTGYLEDLYSVDQMDGQFGEYTRLPQNPGGENIIVMFKSCFPNSRLLGNQNDPIPSIENNPMKGQSEGSESYTIANAKGIYIDLLEYFKTRNDKLFIVITAPPLMDGTYADNARSLNQWLVNDWLANYPLKNVFVFDFYNCLTTNGGNFEINDLGSINGNHHRWWNGAIQHVFNGSSNTNAYPSDNGNDDHPNPAGNKKTTAEYVPLLNVAYNRWKESITDVDELISIDDSPAFSILPNPVSENFLINYQLPGNSYLRIEIINVLGKLIEKFNYETVSQSGCMSYNCSQLNNGEYFLKFSTKWGIKSLPFIICK